MIHRLKSFESSVAVSRKAFRVGKFDQDLNDFRNSDFNFKQDLALSVLAYGGEGLYYFIEQFIWLIKSGLIDIRHSPTLQKISAYAELFGYFGSIALKLRDLRVIHEDEFCLGFSIEIAITKGIGCVEEGKRLRKLKEKKMRKRLSVVQDLVDALMAVNDTLEVKGRAIFYAACAVFRGAFVSTQKNWVFC